MRRSGFDPKSAYGTFVVDKVALWQGFLRVLRFYPLSIIPTKLHIQLYLRVAVNRKTNGRGLGTFLNIHIFTFFFFLWSKAGEPFNLPFRTSVVIAHLHQWDTLCYHDTILISNARWFQIITVARRYAKTAGITSVTSICVRLWRIS
jgi:hypothetical protein